MRSLVEGLVEARSDPSTSLRLVPLPVPGRIRCVPFGPNPFTKKGSGR
jgi:hypothetical protein